MLKQGAQKGGPKGENKWLKHQSAHACAVQTHLATFHENSEYHRKCLHFGSHFQSLWVLFRAFCFKVAQGVQGRAPKR